MARQKVPVSVKALVQRINRRLKDDEQILKKSRGARARLDLGEWYVLNWNRNLIVDKRVDPEELARELGVLHEWEVLVSENDE